MQIQWDEIKIKSFLKEFVDFTREFSPYQRSLRHELLLKAFSGKRCRSSRGKIWDLTLGLGEDSWILCRLGYSVLGFEKNEFLFQCLWEARNKALNHPSYASIAKRFDFRLQDSVIYLKNLNVQNLKSEDIPDFCYLDPMFQFEKTPNALPKKEMQALRFLLKDVDYGNHANDHIKDLIFYGLKVCKKRVVLKWHKHLKYEGNIPPTYVIEGTKVQFLVFVKNN